MCIQHNRNERLWLRHWASTVRGRARSSPREFNCQRTTLPLRGSARIDLHPHRKAHASKYNSSKSCGNTAIGGPRVGRAGSDCQRRGDALSTVERGEDSIAVTRAACCLRGSQRGESGGEWLGPFDLLVRPGVVRGALDPPLRAAARAEGLDTGIAPEELLFLPAREYLPQRPDDLLRVATAAET